MQAEQTFWSEYWKALLWMFSFVIGGTIACVLISLGLIFLFQWVF